MYRSECNDIHCILVSKFFTSFFQQNARQIIHIISYHIVDLKRQNRLKVGTNKPKLKVKMQSVCPEKTS